MMQKKEKLYAVTADVAEPSSRAARAEERISVEGVVTLRLFEQDQHFSLNLIDFSRSGFSASGARAQFDVGVCGRADINVWSKSLTFTAECRVVSSGAIDGDQNKFSFEFTELNELCYRRITNFMRELYAAGQVLDRRKRVP